MTWEASCFEQGVLLLVCWFDFVVLPMVADRMINSRLLFLEVFSWKFRSWRGSL
jgi:hypothetical protein